MRDRREIIGKFGTMAPGSPDFIDELWSIQVPFQ